MNSLYSTAFLFGVTLALAVGPIALLIIRAGMERGFPAAFNCAAGAAVADLLFAFLAASASAAIVPRLESGREWLAAASAVLLIGIGAWLILQAILSARRPIAERAVPQYGFRATFVLTLVNPLTLVTFASFIGQLRLTGGWPEALGVAFAVGSGSLAIATIFAAGGAALNRVLSDARWILALNALSGAGILAFGVRGLIAIE